MKKTFSYIRTMAAVLLAGATIVACTMNDLPDNGPKTYSVTINAGSAQTKALSFGTNSLLASWAEDDLIDVFDKDGYCLGTLTATYINPLTFRDATFSGTVTGTIAVGDELELRYQYHDFSEYASQDGRLNGTTTSAEKFDYATATVEVASTEGNILTFTDNATFRAKTCIVMLDITDGTNPLNVTSLTLSYINAFMSIPLFTFNPKPATYTENGYGRLYFALPSNTDVAKLLNTNVSALNDMTFSFSTTEGSCTKSGYPFEAGKYYKATLTLTN